jgi:hypothetical protein
VFTDGCYPDEKNSTAFNKLLIPKAKAPTEK